MFDTAVKISPLDMSKAPTAATFLYPNLRNTGPPKKEISIPKLWLSIMIRVPWVAERPVSSKASWKIKPNPAIRGRTTT